MPFNLISTDKKFSPLFWTQFLGALNDNFLKNALLVLITFKGISIGVLQTDKLVAFASGLFILPFLIFSPLAGQVADKYQKSRVILYTKIWELGIMILAVLGFYYESYWLLLGVLFLIGVQSTFFGPVKFSIIPQIVQPEQLVKGNAYVELGTFLALLIGTIAGGLSITSSHVTLIVSIVLISVSIAGIFASLKIPQVPIGNPNLRIVLNPFPTIIQMWKLIKENKVVFNGTLGISWFWFFGTGILAVLPIYCKIFLGANEQVLTAFLTVFTIGIGVGSILCEKLSFKRVEIGLVPIGSLGMAIFLLDLFLTKPSWQVGSDLIGFYQFVQDTNGRRLLIDFFVTSLFGGLFIVPLYALIQERSHPESRSRVIAANNIMNSLFMVAASFLIIMLYALNLTCPQIFLTFCILNTGVGIYIYSIVPEFTLRFMSWLLVNLMYRPQIKGIENLPKEGPILLACNHVSMVDWLIVMGAIRRPTRFIMQQNLFETPILNYLLKHSKVIPLVGPGANLSQLETSYKHIDAKIREGQIICIFPEEKMTRDGNLGKLKPDILNIIQQNPIPTVPMAINNLWGSMFSHKNKSFIKAPRKFWNTINLNIGTPILAEDLSLERLEQEIRKLMDKPS